MPNQHLLDNWTLQNAGELICGGLDGDTTHELQVSPDLTAIHCAERSADVLRLEAVCQLLHHVVFADVMFVDEDYATCWQEFVPLRALQEQGLLATKPFQAAADHWVPRRELMVEELCFSPAVRERHLRNVASFAATGTSADQFFAQLIWGGAGMLARAEYFRLLYAPHPTRDRFFAHTSFLRGPTRAQDQVAAFVQSQRIKLFERVDGSGFLARFNMPAVAVEIINEASSFDDLISVAMQIRQEYSELRGWVGQLQSALDAENIAEVISRQKLLQSVSRHIDSLISITPAGDTTVQLGLSWLKVTAKGGSPLNAVLNRYGIRAQLNRLALAPPGQRSLKKILKFLGEEHTERGLRLEREFLERAGRTNDNNDRS